jgi:hypothetical protein
MALHEKFRKTTNKSKQMNTTNPNIYLGNNSKKEHIFIKTIEYSNIFTIFSILIGSAFEIYWNIISPYWTDEAFTGGLACQKDFLSTLNLTAGDVHPPLYICIIHVLFAITGCNLLFARLLGATCIFLSIIYLYKKHDSKTSIWITYLLTTSENFWHYTFDARSYALILASSITAIACWGSTNKKDWYIGCISCFFAASLHYIAIFLPVIYFLHSAWIDKNLNKRKIIVLITAWTILAAYYIYSIFRSPPHLSDGFWIKKPTLVEALGIVTFFFTNKLIVCTFFIAMGTGIFFSLTKTENINKIVFGPILAFVTTIVLYLASYIQPIFIYKYTYFIFPILAFSFSFAVSTSISNFKKNKPAFIAWLFLIASSSFIYLLSSLQLDCDRHFEWYSTYKYSKCYQEDCGFILNDPVLPAITNNQYIAMATVFLKDKTDSQPKVKWFAVRPENFDSWLTTSKIKKFISVRLEGPIANLIKTGKIKCKKMGGGDSYECISI